MPSKIAPEVVITEIQNLPDNTDTVIPTGNGTVLSQNIPGQLLYHQVYIEFFSDSTGFTAVTPTAGTVTISGRPVANNFIPATDSEVDANTCGNPDSTYTPPTMTGPVHQVKAVFNGVTGAAYCRITLFSHGF